MKFIRAAFLIAFILAHVATSAVMGTLVLCVEADGCVSLEDSTSGCCTGSIDRPQGASTETKLVDNHTSCDSCTDVVIAGSPTASPNDLDRVGFKHPEATSSTGFVPSQLELPFEARIVDRTHTLTEPPRLRSVVRRC